MKLLLLFLVTTCSAAIFQVPTTSTGSLRVKMIREGTYSDFLASQRAARLHQRSSGFQPILDFADDTCIGNISIGTPPQQLSVFMDTTSANLWVMDAKCNSTDCNTDPAPGVLTRRKFNTTLSTTFGKSNRKFSIAYRIGDCSGYLGTDNIQLGGLTIGNQVFGVADSVDYFHRVEPYDGMFGLGWPSISVDQVTPPIQTLIAQNQLDAPMFTLWRGKKAGEKSYDGLFTYGGFDTKNCDANITYAPLSSKTFWQFKVDNFDIGRHHRVVEQAIIDTGSFWFGFSNAIFTTVISQTDATWDCTDDVYTVACSTINSQPDLLFTIGGRQFPIEPVDYIIDVGREDGKCVIAMFQIGNNGFGPSIVFGNIFIRQYCNVFDIGNARIGFAESRHA